MVELRREFAAQEKYRQLLLDGLMRVSKKLSEQGAQSIASVESPASTGAEIYWSGFGSGQLEAYGSSAAAISELHVIASLGVLE